MSYSRASSDVESGPRLDRWIHQPITHLSHSAFPPGARAAMKFSLILLASAVIAASGSLSRVDAADDLRQAVTFYASFDEKLGGDFGQGDLRLWSYVNDPAKKGGRIGRLGYDTKKVSLSSNGKRGGALETQGGLADGAFLYVPVAGKFSIPKEKSGWGGAVSLWVKADLEKIGDKSMWDPVQITERNWNDGSLWCDLADGKSPRDLRLGVFPVVPAGQKAPELAEGEKIWIRAKASPFRSQTWHHIVLTWNNFDSGKPDAWAECYLDGKLLNRASDRQATMHWNPDKARIMLGLGLIGMIDDVAVFNRPVTSVEITRLHLEPGLLKNSQ